MGAPHGQPDHQRPVSAAGIFPSFIINRTNQMAIDLVQYFNSLPLKLPYFNTPPHTPNNRGAIQNYVYGSVAGGGTSLQQSLLAIPLPTTAGSDLEFTTRRSRRPSSSRVSRP